MTTEIISDELARRIPKRVHQDTPSTLPDAWRTFFQYTSPRVMTALMVISLTAKIVVGGWTVWDLAVAAAIIGFWPVQEWLIHVFILHFKPKKILGRTIDPVVAQKHRLHHRDPWRLELVFIPTHILPLAGPAVFALYWLIFPTLPMVLTGLATNFLFSLHYEWVHYLVHTRYTPKSKIYHRLWKNHRLHHFMNENYWYGVSMLSGDKLLRTAPAREAVEPSDTVRTLGVSIEPELR